MNVNVRKTTVLVTFLFLRVEFAALRDLKKVRFYLF